MTKKDIESVINYIKLLMKYKNIWSMLLDKCLKIIEKIINSWVDYITKKYS